MSTFKVHRIVTFWDSVERVWGQKEVSYDIEAYVMGTESTDSATCLTFYDEADDLIATFNQGDWTYAIKVEEKAAEAPLTQYKTTDLTYEKSRAAA